MIGFYLLSKRNITFKNESITGFYGRYLSILPSHSNKGMGHILKTKAVEYVLSLLDLREKAIIYSYIEENNKKSLSISKNEYSLYSKLKSNIFFRFFPKKHSEFARCNEAELQVVKEKLLSTQSNYSFFFLDNIGYDNNYFIIKEDGKIVAGMQANPTAWKIAKIKGSFGILIKIIEKIPVINKVFNSKNYKFVAIESIYLEKGKEKYLYPLLESILNEFSYNTVVLEIDTNNPIQEMLSKDKQLGIIEDYKLTTPINTLIMFKTHNIEVSVHDFEHFSPALASSFDFT